MTTLDSTSTTSLPLTPKEQTPEPPHPRRWIIWAVLVVSCIGHYWCNSLPSSLESFMGKDSPFGLKSAETALLSTLSQWPSIVMALIGGALSDRFGVFRCRIIFCSFEALGQSIIALGCYYKNYALMLVGRFIFGVGGEAFSATTGVIIIDYFASTKSLFLAMAISTSFGRISTAAVSHLAPRLMDKSDMATWVTWHMSGGFLLSLGCLLLCVVLYVVSHGNGKKGAHSSRVSECTDMEAGDMGQGTTEMDETDDVVNESKSLIQILTEFGATYWILTVVMGISYLLTSGWLFTAQTYLVRRFNFDETYSGTLIATVSLISAAVGPIISTAVDNHFGKKSTWMIISSLFLLASHMIFNISTSQDDAWVKCAIFLMGIGMSIGINISWSFIGLLVDEKYTGKAVGICCAFVSGLLALIPPIHGKLVDDKNAQHEPSEPLNIMYAAVAVACTFLLIVIDRRKSRILL